MKCENLGCGKEFDRYPLIDGKKRNCQNRKYCFDCSPFGCHNTSTLEESGKVYTEDGKFYKERNCLMCGRLITRKQEKGLICWTCTNRKNRHEKVERIKQFTGNACWICGYNKCWQALDFHHVDPSTKKFNLTLREIQFSWDRIFPEVRKCILVCCRCHREIHAKLIPQEDIKKLWENNWDNTI